jgi:hypothetical protein
MRRLGRRGQHVGEYAVVIGMAAVAVLSAQGLARRVISRHLASAGTAVLGPPGAVDGAQHSQTASGVDASGNGYTRVTRFGSIRQGSESSGFILAEPAGPFTKPNLARALARHPGAFAFVTMLDADGDKDFMGRDAQGRNVLKMETDKDGKPVIGPDGLPIYIEVEDGRPDVLPINAAGRFIADGKPIQESLEDASGLASGRDDPSKVKDGSWEPTDAIILLDENGDGEPDALDTNGDWQPDWAMVMGGTLEARPTAPEVLVRDSQGYIGIISYLFQPDNLSRADQDAPLPDLLPSPGKASGERPRLRDAQRVYRNQENEEHNAYDGPDGLSTDGDATDDEFALVTWVPIDQAVGPLAGGMLENMQAWEFDEDAKKSFTLNTDEKEFFVLKPGETRSSNIVKPVAYADLFDEFGEPGADGTPDVAALYLDDAAELGYIASPGTESWEKEQKEGQGRQASGYAPPFNFAPPEGNLVLGPDWQPMELGPGGALTPIQPQKPTPPSWLAWMNGFLSLGGEKPAEIMVVPSRGDGVKDMVILTQPDGSQDIEYLIPTILVPMEPAGAR